MNRVEWHAVEPMKYLEARSIIWRGDAIWGADPQHDGAVETQCVDSVVRQALRHLELPKASVVVAEQSVLRANPQRAVGRNGEGRDSIDVPPRRIHPLHRIESKPVEARHSAKRPHPDISVRRLGDGVH